MIDREKVITHLDDMRLFADTRVHSIVSPENWGIYSDLCDFIDLIKEEVLDLLKDQAQQIDEISDEYIDLGREMAKLPKIVMCKDCKHWKDNCCYNRIIPCPQPDESWFCADGERA